MQILKAVNGNIKLLRLELATQVKQVYWQYVYLTAKQKLLSYQDSLYSGLFKGS